LQQAVGLVVINEPLGLRVPSKRTPSSICDVAEVADRRGAVSDGYIADGFTPGPDTVQPVILVSPTLVQVHIVGSQWFLKQAWRVGLKVTPVDHDSTEIADELDPGCTLLLGTFHDNIRFVHVC
jgi:hypothetical protein